MVDAVISNLEALTIYQTSIYRSCISYEGHLTVTGPNVAGGLAVFGYGQIYMSCKYILYVSCCKLSMLDRKHLI
jgi:hypothetical protein